MKYYVSTLANCKDVKERQDSFLGYPTSGVTKNYSSVLSIEDSSDYTVIISDDFYNELTIEEKNICADSVTGDITEYND